jgi:hypothetical protein
MRIDAGQQEYWALFHGLRAGYAIFVLGSREFMGDAPLGWDCRELYPVKNSVAPVPNIILIMVCILDGA